MAVSVAPAGGVGKREEVELVACPASRSRVRWKAYEKVLTDAMAGDATLFARQDYVEEAWRIVDPMLKAETPVYPYAPHTWGAEPGGSAASAALRVGCSERQ